MAVAQVVVAASPGDAVTSSALQARDELRAAGVECDLYARYFDPRLEADVSPLVELPSDMAAVYHASIGEPEVYQALCEREGPLLLMYHNISPAAAFEPYDPAFARLLEVGRAELAGLAGRADVAFAASQYNAAELRELGYRDVRVAPLDVDHRRLLEVDPDPGTVHHLDVAVEGPVVLFVGQLLPHKRPDFLIGAYHALATTLQPEAHLILVGVGRLGPYREALQGLVSELNLTGAWLTGEVTEAELAAFYRRADVFVTASEHEGFCAPLLEAMAFGVPVIARDFAAVPETLGSGGLLLPADDSFLLMTEAIDAVLTDEGLRVRLTGAGRDRLAEFDTARAGTTLGAQLLELVR
jgi:glycosyltransferase involved in cell wall biosynthesis